MAQYINRAGNAFALEVGLHVLELKNFTKKVWQESVIRLMDEMQLPVGAGGNMPVQTGFLRSSLQVGLLPVAENSMSRPSKTGSYEWDSSFSHDVVRQSKVGETIYMGYAADYAAKAEFMHGFQRLAVQNWPAIIRETVNDLRSSFAGTETNAAIEKTASGGEA
jgi:hypothetical protein